MSQQDKSLYRISTKATIAAGTQVVLQTTKPVSGSDKYKKPGSVGVVLESPADNVGPYLVQFADGLTVQARFDELSLRRKEIDVELEKVREDLKPYVIYRCQVGSKAYGLAGDDSDDDVRGVFLPPARIYWSLYRLPQQLESNVGKTDEVYWELEKYLKLALKANPNVLETLWTPLVLQADSLAQQLRSMRDAFLSKHIYKTYSGYVLSQFRRMANAYKSKGAYKAKHAMHLIRLLHCGIAALETGEIQVDVSCHRDELLRIRNDRLPFEEVKSRALELEQEFQRAFESTKLPQQPDFDRVDAFLIQARRSTVDD